MAVERRVRIGPDHPSLPGHFPGHPIIPGVVLLNEVLDSLRQAMQEPVVVTGLPIVKFHAPLMPGEDVTISIEPDAPGQATFRCHVGTRLVASGSVDFTAAPPRQRGVR